jgi:uncharacterized membrane protein SpoIIM required for sporulation
MALLVTRREVRDSFRDWRIIFPLLILTFFFPALATFTARLLFNFVAQFNASLVGERLVPFILLVVGFFPMSFSLVIALETFVGEKERKSLEPLLSTPLTNSQLYVGKMFAAIIPPLITSYLGIAVYVVGLVLFANYVIPAPLFIQIVLLSTVQGLLMVSAAVIVSSQTNTVRASNLLASFIIVPMALLVQLEAVALFWGNTEGLWWLVLALFVTALIFIRTGVKLFNREELLGQDIDQLRLIWINRQFWDRFTARDIDNKLLNPIAWYRNLLGKLPDLKLPGAACMIGLMGGFTLGLILAGRFPLDSLGVELSGAQISENINELDIMFSSLPRTIFLQNIRVVLIAALLGIFTLGVTDILIFMLPWLVIGFLYGQIGFVGDNPALFMVAAILPHGIIEIPALLLIFAAALRWHMSIMDRPPKGTISEQWTRTAADFWQITIGMGIPLLAVAAFVEAYVTPRIVLWIYGT